MCSKFAGPWVHRQWCDKCVRLPGWRVRRCNKTLFIQQHACFSGIAREVAFTEGMVLAFKHPNTRQLLGLKPTSGRLWMVHA